jgi:hypothetical protein
MKTCLFSHHHFVTTMIAAQRFDFLICNGHFRWALKELVSHVHAIPIFACARTSIYHIAISIIK